MEQGLPFGLLKKVYLKKDFVYFSNIEKNNAFYSLCLQYLSKNHKNFDQFQQVAFFKLLTTKFGFLNNFLPGNPVRNQNCCNIFIDLIFAPFSHIFCG